MIDETSPPTLQICVLAVCHLEHVAASLSIALVPCSQSRSLGVNDLPSVSISSPIIQATRRTSQTTYLSQLTTHHLHIHTNSKTKPSPTSHYSKQESQTHAQATQKNTTLRHTPNNAKNNHRVLSQSPMPKIMRAETLSLCESTRAV